MTDEFETLSGYAQKNDRIEELERELTVLRRELDAAKARIDFEVEWRDELRADFVEQHKGWAQTIRKLDAAEAELTELRDYVRAHEMHQAWCNGGYEGETCTCDLRKRLARYNIHDEVTG